MDDIKKLLAPIMGPLKLLALLIVGWKLWPLFSGLFGLIVPPVVKLSDDIKDDIQKDRDKKTVAKVNPKASSDDVDKFRKDAETLATALGYNPEDNKNKLIPDRALAFSTAKEYSKYIMLGSRAIVVKGKKVERLDKLQLPVLYALYSEITKGRKLDADLMAAFAGLANKERHDIYVSCIRP